jgi:parallel beta-helix repeat protein
MDHWTRFFDWCQRPSKIKIRTFNPRNAVVLVTFSIILASSITFGTWRYQVASVPKITFIPPEDIETLTITTDTTLTEDYFGNIVIGADGVTLDGDGHMIIGPGTDFVICDPDTKRIRATAGILLEGRTGVTVKNCRVTGFIYGFCLNGADGNTLQGNTANDNGIGFDVGFSSNNTFFHNNLINNDIQAFVFTGYANTWDDGYPSGGNYWSDYTGVDTNGDGIGDTPYVIEWNDYIEIDTNGDGIGDTPYVIDENIMDRFPLTAPTSVFDDGT